MRPLSLLFGLSLLIALSGCASDDSTTPEIAQTTDTATPEASGDDASDESATDAECAPEHGLNDIPSPGSCAATMLGETRLEVQYGAPSVRDREIFGALVPYGEVWRTGANEASTFSTSSDLLVDGDTLAAGTYGLFTLPNETEWEVIFNAVSEQWGAFEYDDGQDVLRVTTVPEATEAPVERFLISFEDEPDGRTMLVIAWADTRVSVPITLADASGEPGA